MLSTASSTSAIAKLLHTKGLGGGSVCTLCLSESPRMVLRRGVPCYYHNVNEVNSSFFFFSFSMSIVNTLSSKAFVFSPINSTHPFFSFFFFTSCSNCFFFFPSTLRVPANAVALCPANLVLSVWRNAGRRQVRGGSPFLSLPYALPADPPPTSTACWLRLEDSR